MGPGIWARGLIKVYRGGVRALDGVSFELPGRGLSVLVGPNGAGKTTLVRILSTIIRPSGGEARVMGFDVVGEARRVREIVAVVPQEGEPDRYLTPWEHVYLYLRARGLSDQEARDGARRALEEVGLWERRNTVCARLSGGQRRRVLIATALAVPAEVYFLDEPTVGLDPVARRGVWEVLQRRSRESLVVLTTHYMEEAEQLGETVLMLFRGRLVAQGAPSELVARLGYRYRVDVEAPCAGLAEAGLSVTHAAESPRGCAVYASGEEELLGLLRRLLSAGFRFAVSRVGLEDVFLAEAGVAGGA